MTAVTQETIDTLNTKLKISVSNDDYQPLIDDSLKQLRKKVELKGFRKGMVPVTLVKKMYGNQVLAEELDKLINQELKQFIDDNKLDILGNPIPTENNQENSIDINANKDYEFNFELGLSPEFNLGVLDKKTVIELNKIKVDNQLIESELERIRKQAGHMTNPDDEVQEEDVIFVEFTELDESGKAKENGIVNSTALPVDMIKDETVRKEVLKLKLEDTTALDIFSSFDKEEVEIKKQFLDVTDENVLVGNKFNLQLKKINRMEPAEMNQAFFDKVFGPETVKGEQEFKDKLKEEIQKSYDRESNMKLRNDLVVKLVDEINLKLPDEFLKKWIQLSNEKPITSEEVETSYPEFAKSMCWNLIVNKITKEHNLEVSKDELAEHAKQTILQQFGGHNDAIDDEQLNAWAQSVLQNKEHAQKSYDQILGDKVFELIKEKVEIKEKEVSLEEFKNLN